MAEPLYQRRKCPKCGGETWSCIATGGVGLDLDELEGERRA